MVLLDWQPYLAWSMFSLPCYCTWHNEFHEPDTFGIFAIVSAQGRSDQLNSNKMLQKIGFIIVLVFSLVSCQFTETIDFNEDGSGRLSISMDMKEMMAFGGMADDSTFATKVDTIVHMRDFLAEKKDSIAMLPQNEQDELKKMESYSFRTVMDPETDEMYFDIFTEFKNIEDAGDVMNAFSKSGQFMQGLGDDTEVGSDEDSSDVLGVKFSYKNGKFKRDAYIRDKEKYKMQMDSIASAESFLSSMRYTLKYTFPRRIAKSSVEDAKFSLDGKTIEIERTFLQYMKDPDMLDLELELEN